MWRCLSEQCSGESSGSWARSVATVSDMPGGTSLAGSLARDAPRRTARVRKGPSVEFAQVAAAIAVQNGIHRLPESS